MEAHDMSGNVGISVSIGNPGKFITVCLPDGIAQYELSAPCFEVNRAIAGADGWSFAGAKESNSLAHGGREDSYLFREKTLPVTMMLDVRSFADSPFIRFRYRLEADKVMAFTKQSRRDNITYTGFSRKDQVTVTELQFSQFDPLVHSFIPCFQPLSSAALAEGAVYPGPITLLEGEGSSALLAYEHGAEYPDSYLEFTANRQDNGLNLVLQARKGNTYSGQQIDSTHPFITPWFHFAACRGNIHVLLEHYRLFFLQQICENLESRKPYVFYNTWNNQEQNKYFHNLPYLHSMNLEHTLTEIDIAAKMGVDVFVIDTGWYNKTGDWLVNLDRFPDALVQVKQRLHGFGMKLGLWFNPIVAAGSSKIMREHPEYKISLDGTDNDWGEIWETEHSWGMCLASDYSDYFIKKMVELNHKLGVTYFKWDAIGQYGCNSPKHHHGDESNSPQERLESYSYQMGLEMIRVVEEVQKQCPDVIVDFDITEGARFVGLGFLSVGKYFLMNNGPYYSSFDIPAEIKHTPDTINVFFYPGAARARICRQGIQYDSFIPSVLFLTHFLPDKPVFSQNNSLASMMLGGNGIWGNLLALDEEDIHRFSQAIGEYKQVAGDVTATSVKSTGFIGSSPEIYEKLNYQTSKGILCFFTRAAGTFIHFTEKINPDQPIEVIGADEYELTGMGRLKVTVTLGQDDARVVFIR